MPSLLGLSPPCPPPTPNPSPSAPSPPPSRCRVLLTLPQTLPLPQPCLPPLLLPYPSSPTPPLPSPFSPPPSPSPQGLPRACSRPHFPSAPVRSSPFHIDRRRLHLAYRRLLSLLVLPVVASFVVLRKVLLAKRCVAVSQQALGLRWIW